MTQNGTKSGSVMLYHIHFILLLDSSCTSAIECLVPDVRRNPNREEQLQISKRMKE